MATKTKKAHTAELVKLSAELPPLIDALEVEIEAIAGACRDKGEIHSFGL